MRKVLKNKIGYLIGFVVFCLVASLASIIVIFFMDLKSETKAVVLTALISVSGLIWSKQAEKNKEIENTHRVQKIQIYEKFIEFTFKRVFRAEKLIGKKAVTEAEMITNIVDFNVKLMLWGSDDVVKTWQKFKDGLSKDSSKIGEQSIALEAVILAIRKDLGHKNKSLKKGNLLHLFLNNEAVDLVSKELEEENT